MGVVGARTNRRLSFSIFILGPVRLHDLGGLYSIILWIVRYNPINTVY